MGLTDTSKFLSLILRHKPETIGIKLDEHGWADISELISGISKTLPVCMEPLSGWSQTAWRSRQKQMERRICQSLVIIGIDYFREWSCMRIIRYW